MQHFGLRLRTNEMLDDVADDVRWNQTSFNIIQHHASSCNMVAKRVQHEIQQCWMMLYQHVGSVWPGLIENDLGMRFAI